MGGYLRDKVTPDERELNGRASTRRDEHIGQSLGNGLNEGVVILAQVDELALFLASQSNPLRYDLLNVLEDVLNEGHEELVDHIEDVFFEGHHDLIDNKDRLTELVGASIRHKKGNNRGQILANGRAKAANHAVHVEHGCLAERGGAKIRLEGSYNVLHGRYEELHHVLTGLARILRKP